MLATDQLLGETVEPVVSLTCGQVLLQVLSARGEDDVADDSHHGPLENCTEHCVLHKELLRQAEGGALALPSSTHLHLLVVRGTLTPVHLRVVTA